MPSRLITARHLAARNGCVTVTQLFMKLSDMAMARKVIPVRWDGTTFSEHPVYAYVDFGRWLAACPSCGKSSYVDPDEPIFFCSVCGNGGLGNHVIFPADQEQIEAALLERPVIRPTKYRDVIECARLSRPLHPLATRNWTPGQSLEMVLAVNLEVKGL